MIEITNVEAVEDADLEKMAKIYPEGFARTPKYRPIEKGCRPATNKRASQRRRTNVLRRYINRLYRICLLNTLVAITLAVIYVETKNEMVLAAMYTCEANALLTWMCAD